MFDSRTSDVFGSKEIPIFSAVVNPGWFYIPASCDSLVHLHQDTRLQLQKCLVTHCLNFLRTNFIWLYFVHTLMLFTLPIKMRYAKQTFRLYNLRYLSQRLINVFGTLYKDQPIWFIYTTRFWLCKQSTLFPISNSLVFLVKFRFLIRSCVK